MSDLGRMCKNQSCSRTHTHRHKKHTFSTKIRKKEHLFWYNFLEHSIDEWSRWCAHFEQKKINIELTENIFIRQTIPSYFCFVIFNFMHFRFSNKLYPCRLFDRLLHLTHITQNTDTFLHRCHTRNLHTWNKMYNTDVWSCVNQ